MGEANPREKTISELIAKLAENKPAIVHDLLVAYVNVIIGAELDACAYENVPRELIAAIVNGVYLGTVLPLAITRSGAAQRRTLASLQRRLRICRLERITREQVNEMIQKHFEGGDEKFEWSPRANPDET